MSHFNFAIHTMKIWMKLASWFIIAVGFITFILAVSENVTATRAAFGVFLLFLGFNGFYSLRFTQLEGRVAQLEETVKQMKGDKISFKNRVDEL